MARIIGFTFLGSSHTSSHRQMQLKQDYFLHIHFFCHFKNLFENNVYFFCSIFFAKSVLSDPEISSKGQIYKFMHNLMGTGLLTSNGDKWQKRRRMLGPFYRSNRYLDIYLMIFQLRIYLIKYWNIIAMEVFTHH